MTHILMTSILFLFFSCSFHHHKKIGHHSPGEMNKEFLSSDLDVEKWKKNFSEKDRDVVKFRSEIVNALRLKSGDTVADVGAGTGLFIPMLAKKVTKNGKVYAVDISPKFVEDLRSFSQKNNLSQVEVVLGSLYSTNLKKDSVNTILVVDTYHHFDYPEKMLSDFKDSLTPNGKLVIVDFAKTPEARPWIQNHIRLTESEYINEIEKNGFKFLRKEKINFKESFMLVFEVL